MSTNAERLARRTTNDDFCFWENGFHGQHDLFAFTFKISPVGFTSVSILLKTTRLKSLRLETKSQPATTRKKIEHKWFSVSLRTKKRIYFLSVIHRVF